MRLCAVCPPDPSPCGMTVIPAKAGPVRRGFSVLSLASLGYWVALHTTPSLRAKPSNPSCRKVRMDCFVARAPRNDGQTHLRILAAHSARGLPTQCRCNVGQIEPLGT